MFRFKKIGKWVATSLMVASLTGCSTMTEINKETENSIKENQKTYVDSSQKTLKSFQTSSVKANMPMLAGTRIVLKKTTLPDVFNETVSYETAGSTLEQIIDDVASEKNIQISFTEAYANEQIGQSSDISKSNGGLNSIREALNKSIPYQFKGTLKDFLNHLASKLDLSWRYLPEKNIVTLYKYESRTFNVSLPKSSKKLSSSIALSGTGDAGGGSVSISGNLELNPWNAMLQGVATILGGNGVDSKKGSGSKSVAKGVYGVATAYPELGYMTVMARPFVLDKVSSYVESVNRQFSKNILVDVKVINLNMNRNANTGLSFSWLKQKLGEYSIGLTPGGILSPSSGNSPGMLAIKNISGMETSQALMQVLASVGDVSIKTQGQVIAVNGQPAPFQQAQEITYVKSIRVQNTANVGTTTAPETDTKVIGFTANFLPTLLQDSRILLEYQIQNSTLSGFQDVTFGESTLKLPQVSSQSLQNHAILRDGQSLMLFSFEREQSSQGDTTGLSSYSTDANKKKDMTIILLTTRVDKRGA